MDSTVAVPHPPGTGDADGSAMADLLRLTCRDCGNSFVSSHQQQREALASGEVSELEERCPHCGTTDVYRSGDYDHGSLIGRIAPVRSSSD